MEGENIRESKQRIEQVMDTLVTAFEAQLDRLFEDDALDVSTDIDVMENMLRGRWLDRKHRKHREQPEIAAVSQQRKAKSKPNIQQKPCRFVENPRRHGFCIYG